MLKPSELPSWSSELWHLYLHGLAIFLRGNIAPNVQCKASAHILWLPISLGSRFNTPLFRTQDFGKLRGTLWVVKFHILLDGCFRVRRMRISLTLVKPNDTTVLNGPRSNLPLTALYNLRVPHSLRGLQRVRGLVLSD